PVDGGSCTQVPVGLAVDGTLNAQFPSAKQLLGDVEIFLNGGLVTLTGSFQGSDQVRDNQPRNAINVVILTTSMQNRNIYQRLNSLRNGLAAAVGGAPVGCRSRSRTTPPCSPGAERARIWRGRSVRSASTRTARAASPIRRRPRRGAVTAFTRSACSRARTSGSPTTSSS